MEVKVAVPGSAETSKREPKSHVRARRDKPPEYPERFPVPDQCVRWSIAYPEYAPPRYESSKLARPECSPANFADVTTRLLSHEPGGIRYDGVTGEPCNPRGRTGMSGRGVLWHWGPNHAADTLATRFNTDTERLEALLIRRHDGTYALPGGMMNPGEGAADAAARELLEETGTDFGSCGRFVELYRGYVDDPRNTDNAWIETVVFHRDLGPVAPSDMKEPKGGDDAQEAAWKALTPEVINGLYASHASFVKLGLEVLVENVRAAPEIRAAAAALLGLPA